MFLCFPQGDDNTVGGSEMPAVDPSGCTPVRFGDVDFVRSGVHTDFISAGQVCVGCGGRR